MPNPPQQSLITEYEVCRHCCTRRPVDLVTLVKLNKTDGKRGETLRRLGRQWRDNNETSREQWGGRKEAIRSDQTEVVCPESYQPNSKLEYCAWPVQIFQRLWLPRVTGDSGSTVHLVTVSLALELTITLPQDQGVTDAEQSMHRALPVYNFLLLQRLIAWCVFLPYMSHVKVSQQSPPSLAVLLSLDFPALNSDNREGIESCKPIM